MTELVTHIAGKTDSSFSLKETRNYGLNMFFGDNTCTFTLIDQRISRYLVLHHLRRRDHPPGHSGDEIAFGDFLRAVVTTYPWLKSPFRSIHLGYEGQKATLIPDLLYDPSLQEDYLRLNFTVTGEEKVLSDHLPKLAAHLVYAIPQDHLDAVKNFFPQARILHHGSIFMQTVWLISRLRTVVPRVFINLRDDAFDLMVYDGRNLGYFNTFTYIAPEDVVYFVLFAMEQLGHNPEKTPAILFGNIEKGSGLYELLYRYIKHVDFSRRNEGFKYAHALNDLPSHSFYTLFTLPSCGL